MKAARLLLFLFVLVGRVDAFDGATPKTLMRIQLTDYPRQMSEIHAQGFDIAGVDFTAKQVDVVANEVEARYLERRGFDIVSKQVMQISARPDARYLTPETVESSLRQIQAQYPDLTELVSIGKSWEGRDIWAMKITNPRVQPALGKPAIFINGMHHAREVMTPEIPIDAARYLLSAYGSDPKVTHWVDHDEIWLVPMINVDGNNKMWSVDNWWRKNTHNGHGVDINRNYPYAWNTCNGSSSSTSAQDYRGTAPGSEVETQVVMRFVQGIDPVFSLSLHSYSEVVLYPFGCRGQLTPTHEVVEGIGRQMASLLPLDQDPNRFYEAGTPPELLYSVDGGDIDWLYHVAQVIPYVIEVNGSNQGFQPNYGTWRDATVMKTRAAWMLLLDRLDGSGARGRVTDPAGNPVAGATVEVFRTGLKSYSQSNWVTEAGIFHLILNPGQYTVTYTAPGFQTRTEVLALGGKRSDLNIILQPVAASL